MFTNPPSDLEGSLPGEMPLRNIRDISGFGTSILTFAEFKESKSILESFLIMGHANTAPPARIK